MRFFATGSLYNSNSMEEVKFATLYWQSSTHHEYFNLYILWLVTTCRRCEISKKLTLNPTLTAKNTPLFLFPYMGRSFHIFAWGMPVHAHVFSFTHNAVVLSHFRCVHPENFSILTFLWIKTNVAYTRLEVIAKQHSALQVEFITSVKTDLLLCTILLLPPLSSFSKHGHWRSSLYTLYLWFV